MLRHGKSDWDAAYDADHDRPLNPRGEKAARVIGTLLSQCGEIPDLAVTSSAIRARATLELAAASGGWNTTVRVSPELYGTSAQGALQVAAGAASGTERLMLVGHQPAWGSLVHLLTGGSVEIKTATVVGIDLSIAEWADVTEARGSIAYVLQPRMFA